MIPQLTENEIKAVLGLLDPQDVMLEWGSGGSTELFSPHVKEYHSIEHNPEWFEKVQPECPLAKMNLVVCPNVKLPDGPIFETWRGTKKEDYDNYINYVDNLNIPIFTKVFIDGRARKYCAEKVLSYVDENSTVFVHDWTFRPAYHSILEWYSIQNIVDSLCILKKIKK